MTHWKVAAVAAVSATFLLSAPLRAHHSMVVQFDLEKPLTLKGVVTKLIWTNPHSWIFVDVKCPDGRTETWRVETGSQARMVKRGLNKNDLPVGTDVIIGAYGARDGQLKAAGTVVTFPARESRREEATFSLGR